MKIKFKQVKTLLECINQAKQHIAHNIGIKSTGVKGLVNKHCVNNRIAEYAVLYYVQANYYTEDIVSGTDCCNHFGVSEGTILIKNVGIGSLKSS
jgi:hypothetical protein